MRFPAYLLLPIIAAVVLIAAVLGTWLWPEPAVPSPSLAPPVVAAPVVTEPPPAPPAVTPPRPKPMARPVPPRPAEPPPQAMAEPVVVAQPEPEPPPPPPPPEPPAGPTTSPRMSDWSPEKQAEVRKNWMTIQARPVELVMAGLERLERQRDEARARGDQAEVDRLEQILRTRREQVEQMQRAQQATSPGQDGPAPEEQDGLPMQ